MEFLYEYGMFVAKTLTIVLAVLVIVVGIIVAITKNKEEHQAHIELKKLNDKYADIKFTMKSLMLNKDGLKKLEKEEKAKRKAEKKASSNEGKSRVFVVDFDGDIKASAVSNLREEVTAILMVARKEDEVFVRLQSPGGMVNTYGLAASQLARIKDKEIPLTIAVDKVAASGGYMMACVADKIIAAPFAILGSIGVVAQIPNFNRLLKKHDVDYEMITAGEYKRTLTMFGENTDQGRSKFKQDIEDVHALFKDFVSRHRPVVDIVAVSTGEYWFGTRAKDLALVDELQTSDDYLLAKVDEADIFSVKHVEKKSLSDKFSGFLQNVSEKLMTGLWSKSRESSL
ncbi:MAG TPA: protease SohB [Gammaproteobacteria bacterium]|nr:protease SohB [Gammaproteobacteria bacterium]